MTTSHNTHRPPTFVVAASATGLVAAVLSLFPSSADAIPDPIDVPAVVHPAVVHPAVVHPAVVHPAVVHPAVVHPAVDTDTDTAGHGVERSCFITPARWNDALDGPLPRCYT